MELILASTSRYRRELLARLGLPFLTIAPEVDESSFSDRDLDPRALVETLAAAKAAEVASRYPSAVVIGADQTVSLDGGSLGKPLTEENAIAQLTAMSGRAHELITSFAIVHPEGQITHTDITTLVMRSLTEDSIRRYVEADQPLDCAGSYKLEAKGITLFSRIDTKNHTAIIGMPLMALTTALGDLGFPVP